MHRIDTPGNQDNRFDDGNELAGRQGTVVDADWLNGCQEEIAGAIEGLGDDPLEKGTNDQLYIAISAALNAAVTSSVERNNPVETIREFRNDSRDPAIILGLPGSTWARFGTGRVTIGEGYLYPYNYYAGSTDGEARVSLSAEQNGPHTHGLDGSPIDGNGGPDNFHYASGGNYLNFKSDETESSGVGQSHENRQPFIVIYRWVRTA